MEEKEYKRRQEILELAMSELLNNYDGYTPEIELEEDLTDAIEGAIELEKGLRLEEFTVDGFSKTDNPFSFDFAATPTTTNEEGGMQSQLPFRFDLIDPSALFVLAEVLEYGAQKYAPGNWRKIPVKDHINHAVSHLYAYLSGNTSEPHLGHAFARVMFAVAMQKQGRNLAEES